MAAVSEVARKYGRNEVAFTTRLTVEIPWIKYEYVDAVKAYFAEKGIVTGGTGKKVRPLVARYSAGSTRCRPYYPACGQRKRLLRAVGRLCKKRRAGKIYGSVFA